jgi:hypothetical protein
MGGRVTGEHYHVHTPNPTHQGFFITQRFQKSGSSGNDSSMSRTAEGIVGSGVGGRAGSSR